jgi:hypothetical protein
MKLKRAREKEFTSGKGTGRGTGKGFYFFNDPSASFPNRYKL